MKNTCFYLVAASLMSGCVSTSVLYEDGKSNGKKEGKTIFGACYNLSPSYDETDSASRKVVFKPYRLPAPYFTGGGSFGVTERLDLGGSLGLGLWAGGLGATSKFALLPNSSKFNVSLYAGANFSISFEEVENAFISYRQWIVGLPMSIELSENQTLVLQPLFSRDYYKVKIFEDVKYKGAYYPRVYHLGFGYAKKKKRKGGDVFFNTTMNYIPEQKKAYPTFGIAVRK